MILIVEDEVNIRRLIRIFLEKSGYDVVEASNGQEAIDIFYQKPISLIISDVMMPEVNGYEFCKEIRRDSDVPIIILTALSDDESQIKAYNLGAHGYLAKPFKGPLLVSMVKRFYPHRDKLHIGKLELDRAGMKLKVEGEDLVLAPKEYELLEYLINNKGIVMSREKLLNTIWGYEFVGTDRVVDNHIKKLRKKLGNYAKYIKTVVSKGYKFEVEDED